MRSFDQIFNIAAERHGETKMRDHLTSQQPLSPEEIAAIPDDRWLSQATKCVFQAGFNWKVVEAKWEGFEAAFEGFDIGRWVLATDDDISALAGDKRIVRNPQKIKSVPENARFFADLIRSDGGVGRWMGNQPATDRHLQLQEMHKRGGRLGAMTGQYFLRFMKLDSYILSRDVTAALIRENVIDKAPTSKKAKTEVQAAFNQWMEESGHNLTQISRTLAMSISVSG